MEQLVDKNAAGAAQGSLFPKSSPLKLNELPQKTTTQRIYSLSGPVLINPNWDFYSGPSAGPTDVDVGQADAKAATMAARLRQNADYQRLREAAKNKIVTLSKFYTLKENQSLPCHFNQNKDRATLNKAVNAGKQPDAPRVYNQNGAPYQGYGNDIADA